MTPPRDSQSTPATGAPTHYYRPDTLLGFGGVAIGNGFMATPEEQAHEAIDAAWEAGVRYFDTAPFYGFGLGERRFGRALAARPRDEYVLSTKVGRLLKPDSGASHSLWKDVPPFSPHTDFTADGARRSVEDSLQRLGVSRIDVVFIHDLSPDNFGNEWTEHFEVARKGAMVELTRMRDEGMIKGWGLGVNTIEPILRTLEVADADLFLAATQYSLFFHEDALNRLFPACEERGVSLVIGAPFNAGFLTGRDRYNYGTSIPEGMAEKRRAIEALASDYGTDLRTAALQFCAAPPVVSVVLPGARDATQARQNSESLRAGIPPAFWEELKSRNLISPMAPVPAWISGHRRAGRW